MAGPDSGASTSPPGVAPGEGDGLGVDWAAGATAVLPARAPVEASAKKLMRRARPTRAARSREGRNELRVRVVALFSITLLVCPLAV
jgi:hypothetical protein